MSPSADRGGRLEVPPHDRQVEVGREGEHACGVQLDGGLEHLPRLAVEDHPHVDLLAALAGGLRRHAERLGHPPLDVRVVVPADLRAGAPVGHGLGNRFGLVLVRLPVSEGDRSARVRAVVAATEAAKRSPQAVSTYVLLRLAGTLPRPVPDVAAALLGAGTSAVVTNVPGPRQPLSLLDQPLRSVVFWVPQVGRIGVGVSIFSYAGTVTVGVAADAGLALDPDVLAADVDAEISALAAVSAPAGRAAP